MSFSGKRKSARWHLLLAGAALLALLAFAVYNSSRGGAQKQDEELDPFKKLLENPGKLNKAEREELRFQWTRLSPEGRSKLSAALMRSQVEKLRAENAGLSQEQRIDKIRKKLERLRREREKSIRDAKAEAGRLLLSEEEVKKLVKQSLDIFQNELSAKERAELDPLVHEYIMQLNGVFQ